MIYFVGKPEPSDVVHECIHVLCSERDLMTGKSKFQEEFGLAMLEGVTQYLAEQVCAVSEPQIDVTNKAYPKQVKATMTLVGRHGLRLVYNAYFKGETEELIHSMVNMPLGSQKRSDEWTKYNDAKKRFESATDCDELRRLDQALRHAGKRFYEDVIKPQLKEKF